MQTLGYALTSRPYPGRGCLLARTTDGRLTIVYFLTGRSEASRNREICVLDTGDIVVRATDAQPDDPLRHYAAIVRRGAWTVAGNGDQVTPIADALAAGTSMVDAAAVHTYEPDPPVFTSRIWAMVEAGAPAVHHGFVRRSEGGDGGPTRVVWTIDELGPGKATLMTTYDGTPDTISPTVCPVDVTHDAADAEQLADLAWRALGSTLRVALVAVTQLDADATPVIRHR